MKIVIAGAGDVGFHLASLLAQENQDITLIDIDPEVLDHVSRHLDVMTIRGDSASIEVLRAAETHRAQLFLAVTTLEKTNLLTAILAKKMGAKQTIARINNPEYLEPEQEKNFFDLGIDTLISPQLLAAAEIGRLLESCSFTDIFDFEDGAISLVGFTVNGASPLVGRTLKEIDDSTPEFQFRAIALQRGHQAIIPDESVTLRRGDHLHLVAQKSDLDKITGFVGKTLKKVRKVMILGGTPLAFRTAQLLENQYAVSLIEKNKNIGKKLIESLKKTLVIKADPGNIDILKEEGLGSMDAFIALTPNSETNILTSLMANEMGIYKTIALVDNAGYTHISQNIGVDTIINKKILAANNIFRFVRKGKVEAIVSLHGVDAEVIEFVIHKKNRVLKHTLGELHLPEKAIVAAVVRGNSSILPDRDFQMQLGDKVIVFAFQDAIAQVEKLFK